MADTNPKQLILKSFMHEPNDSTNSDQNLETDKKHDVLYVDVDQTTTLKASNSSKDLIFRSNYQSESQNQKVTGQRIQTNSQTNILSHTIDDILARSRSIRATPTGNQSMTNLLNIQNIPSYNQSQNFEISGSQTERPINVIKIRELMQKSNKDKDHSVQQRSVDHSNFNKTYSSQRFTTDPQSYIRIKPSSTLQTKDMYRTIQDDKIRITSNSNTQESFYLMKDTGLATESRTNNDTDQNSQPSRRNATTDMKNSSSRLSFIQGNDQIFKTETLPNPENPSAPKIKIYTRQLDPQVRSFRQIDGEEKQITTNEIKRSTYDSDENVEVFKRQLQSLRSANQILEQTQEMLLKQISGLQMSYQNVSNEKLSSGSVVLNLQREKESYLKRLEDQEEEYQRIHLENSELHHKLQVAEDTIYNIQSSLEQSNSAKFTLEGDNKNLLEQIEIYEKLQCDLKNVENDCENKVHQIQANLEVTMKDYEDQTLNLKNQLGLANQQISDVKFEQIDLERKYDEKKIQVIKLEAEILRLTESTNNNESSQMELQIQVNEYQISFDNLKEEKSKFETENQNLVLKITDLESDIKEREQDILKLIQENERMMVELRKNTNGSMNFAYKIEELELKLTTENKHNSDKVKDLQAQLMFKEEQIQNSNSKAFEERRLKDQAESLLESTQYQNEQLTSQNLKLKEDLVSCEYKLNEARKQIHQLETNLVSNRNARESQQLENSGSRIEDLSVEIQSLRNQIDAQEIQHASAMNLKSEEVQQLKLKLSNIGQALSDVEKLNGNYSTGIQKLESELIKITALYQQSQTNLDDLEFKFESVDRNSNILANQLTEQEKVNRQLRDQINKNLAVKIQELEQQLFEKDNLIHELQIKLKQSESSNENYKLKIGDSLSKIDNLEEDKEKLRELIQVLQSESRDFKMQVNFCIYFKYFVNLENSQSKVD